MAETDILAPGDRTELLEGQIIDMLPIGPFHASSVRRLLNLFARLGGGRWIVDAQSPVRLSGRSEPQPDFVLLRPKPDFYEAAHPTAADVFLLVEVSDSSVRFDREEKLPAYARAGIAEFWLINLIERVVEVYREPSTVAGVYGSAVRLQPGEKIAPAAFPDVVLPVAELLSMPG